MIAQIVEIHPESAWKDDTYLIGEIVEVSEVKKPFISKVDNFSRKTKFRTYYDVRKLSTGEHLSGCIICKMKRLFK